MHYRSTLILALVLAVPAFGNSWTIARFTEAEFVTPTLIGDVKVRIETSTVFPTRVTRLDIWVKGRKLEMPQLALEEVTSPLLEGTHLLVPGICSLGDCSDGPVLLHIPFEPSEPKPSGAEGARCDSSALELVFYAQSIEEVKIVECWGTERQQERVIFAR